MRISEDKLKDHLFEWLLMDYLEGKVKARAARAPLKRRPSTPVQADLKNLYLRYDTQAQLNLADVKPTGFLVKANG